MINAAALHFMPEKSLHADLIRGDLSAGPDVKSFFDVLQSSIYESPDMKGQAPSETRQPRPDESARNGEIENRQDTCAAGFRTEKSEDHSESVKNREHTKNDKKASNEKIQDKQPEDTEKGDPEKKGMVHKNDNEGTPEKVLNISHTRDMGKPEIKEDTDTRERDTLSMLQGLAEMLGRLVDSTDRGDAGDRNSAVMKQCREDLDRAIESLRKNPGRAGMREIADRISAVLEKLDSALPSHRGITELAGFMKQLRKALAGTAARVNTTSRENAVHVADTDPSAQVRDITTRIMNIIHSGGGESSGSTDSDRGFNSGSFLFQSMKDTASSERNSTGSILNRGSSLFREQLESVIQRARIVVQDGKNGKFSIRLHPRELGSINVNLGLEQGVIHGKFLVDSQEARTLLMENIAHLREQMENAGVTVGDFQVNVRDEGSRFSSDQERKDPGVRIPELHAGEAGSEYEISAYSLHEGSINMVI